MIQLFRPEFQEYLIIDLSLNYIPCGYFRVSREDTALDKLAVRKYKEQLIDLGVKEEDIFFDFASGGNSDREGYQTMLSAITKGQYNLVAVPMLSRLNRNVLNSELLLRDLVNSQAKLFIAQSGKIIDPNESNDTLAYRLNSIIDHRKLEDITKIARENVDYKISKNTTWCVPFGYTLYRGKPKLDREPYICLLQKKETISPADILLELIDLIIETKNITQSIESIHFKYGIPKYIPNRKIERKKRDRQYNFYNESLFKHRRPLRFTFKGVKSLVSNPLLKGDVVYYKNNSNKEEIKRHGVFPEAAIISELKFQELQIAKSTRNYSRKKGKNYPYSGLIYCSFCGGRYNSNPGYKRKKDGKQFTRYYCLNSRNGCKAKEIKAIRIEEAAIKVLTSKSQQISNLVESYDSVEEIPEIIQIKEKIKKLEALNFEDKYITKAIAEAKQEIDNLRQKQQLGDESRQQKIEILQQTFANPLYWETLLDEEKRIINKLLIKRIIIGLKDGKSYVERIDLLI